MYNQTWEFSSKIWFVVSPKKTTLTLFLSFRISKNLLLVTWPMPFSFGTWQFWTHEHWDKYEEADELPHLYQWRGTSPICPRPPFLRLPQIPPVINETVDLSRRHKALFSHVSNTSALRLYKKKHQSGPLSLLTGIFFVCEISLEYRETQGHKMIKTKFLPVLACKALWKLLLYCKFTKTNPKFFKRLSNLFINLHRIQFGGGGCDGLCKETC
jgi:hypothetical protein